MWVGVLYMSIHVHREKKVAMWEVTLCISINTEKRVTMLEGALYIFIFLYTEKIEWLCGRVHTPFIHREKIE
jgi:hypothetical protein